ncbi:molybdenum cofactor guanylyltransferase [Salipiger pallidus]|uniref:Molybdenum cofactor guanylyltransferase n=1 Tax=Salipiger pallidus TaxID=1775170 RepID=A0A8J3EID5_9RHOB|nr:molybdenum cofactor guanylyltransferase MobA [Salipiger pallidus]GGG84596.1 molybdenum cofactor guanylyltransferase [Salipiger pallidus]
MKQPLGVILAGGLATRMGGVDKTLLTVGGQSLLSRIIDRLEPQVAGLALNANGDAARFATGLPVLADSIDGFAGPLAGVLAGLDWAADQGADSIVTVAGDTPFFPCDLVPQLMLATEALPHPLALAATPRDDQGEGEALKSGGKLNRHPTFGLWPVALRDDLRAALEGGLRKVVAWTDGHGAGEAVFSAEPFDPFFNVNTPEDLARAEAIASGAA